MMFVIVRGRWQQMKCGRLDETSAFSASVLLFPKKTWRLQNEPPSPLPLRCVPPLFNTSIYLHREAIRQDYYGERGY